MLKLGITGEIGSGKTTASSYLTNEKVIVFNADKEAKIHLKKFISLQNKLIDIFGNPITTNGNLDLKKLAEIAFENKTNQAILNGIMWPEVSILISQKIEKEKKKRSKMIIVDAALLFEANLQHYFDKILLIKAKKNTRLNRAIMRSNLSLNQIEKRMAIQQSNINKEKLSDFIIENNNSIEEFHQELDIVCDKLKI